MQLATEVGRLADGKGLSFEILESGRKRWLYRYRLNGKPSMVVLGLYSDMQLKDARSLHTEARKYVEDGHNPSFIFRKEKELEKENIEKERLSIQGYLSALEEAINETKVKVCEEKNKGNRLACPDPLRQSRNSPFPMR